MKKELTRWRLWRSGSFLESGETIEGTLAVRFPFGGVPYFFLLTGCSLILTDRRLLVLRYGKVTGIAASTIWESPRGACAASLARGKIRITAPDGGFMNGKEMLVPPLRMDDARTFVRRVNGQM